MSSGHTGIHVVFGAGAIGSNLACILRMEGKRVRIVSRRGTGPSEVEALACDASDPNAAAAAAEGGSVVYNCANADYSRWPELLPPLFEGILQAALRAQAKYVVADNLYMYGKPDGPIKEDSPLKGTDPKGALRRHLAEEAMAKHSAGALQVAIVRGSDFYGMTENAVLGTAAFRAVRAGKPVKTLGSLDQPHSLTYVPDMAKALALLGGSDDGFGKVWIAPTAPALTIRQFLTIAAGEFHREPRMALLKRPIIHPLGFFWPLMRELETTLYQWEGPYSVDSTAFETAFPMRPTSLEVGIKATLASLA